MNAYTLVLLCIVDIHQSLQMHSSHDLILDSPRFPHFCTYGRFSNEDGDGAMSENDM